MKDRNICITGVTASGKSSVCDALSKSFPNVRYSKKSEILLAVAKKEYGIEHQDQIKQLNQKDLNLLFELVEKKISRHFSQNEIFLIDDHLRVLVNGNEWIEAPENYTRNHNIGCYMVLLPPPERILENQQKETKDRRRPVRSVSEIGDEQKAVIELLTRWKTKTPFDIYWIHDEEWSQVINNAKRILELWIKQQ